MADWFAPKRYGYGAGLPIAWQGWLATLLYLLIMVGAALLFADRNLWLFASIAVPATAVFVLVAARTTRGGWRWHWGGKE